MSQHVLRLTVDLEREQRGRAAATSLERSFEEWAQRLLEPPRRPIQERRDVRTDPRAS